MDLHLRTLHRQAVQGCERSAAKLLRVNLSRWKRLKPCVRAPQMGIIYVDAKDDGIITVFPAHHFSRLLNTNSIMGNPIEHGHYTLARWWRVTHNSRRPEIPEIQSFGW